MRLKRLYLFYFKNMSRNKLYLTASIGFMLFLSIRIFMYMNTWFDREKYGDLPAEIIVVVQLVSVLYMIYFYLTFSNELKYGTYNFFVDGYKILVEKITALLFVHISFQAILLSIVYFIFLIIYLFVGIEWSSIYGSLFRYLLDYMFFPLFFAALTGIIIALIFGAKKISIIFILIIWFFTGGINQEVLASFFDNVESTDWETLLSIGPNSIYVVYVSYMGFNTSIGLELRILTWLFLLLFLMLLVLIKWARIKRERNRTLAIVLLLLFVSFGTGYLSIQSNTSTFNNADNELEVERYRNMQDVETDLNYDIASYRITLEDDRVDAEIKFEKTNTDKPSFQLYHAYPIHQITIDGENALYSREGDIVRIESPTDSFKEIVFKYELVDTGLVYFEGSRAILAANLAWYPKKREEHMYKPTNLTNIDITDSPFETNKQYHFELFADGVLFTNLTNVGNHYEGDANGISIIKGQGNQMNYKDYEVTYPADWPKMSKRIGKVTNAFETILKELKQISSTKITSLPNKVVFTTDPATSVIDTEQFIYNVGGITVSISDPEVISNFVEEFMDLTVEPRGKNDMFQEWKNLSSLMIKEEYDFQIFSDQPITETHHSSFETIYRIYYEFSKLKIEEKRKFLKQWYIEMDETLTWDDVKALIEERKDE
ncbi:hypothetical protein J14TS2_30970 [Bacillus sp. J14TS2]|uniref:ABC transporter permease n=1 Tax=Bacillus sp. J14TS2 TaxID=2807188 RepID=UPI001B2260F6|nr:ABC transporter permease [Bacillus sp. J14TS2]GIN72622.1 hypothetical protein J14TS2_30970 [Bacillus sp. J14TS2]